MDLSYRRRGLCMVFAVAFIFAAAHVAPAVAAPVTRRDGHNDFAFLNGAWRTEYRRLRHPLHHDREWYTCPGRSDVHSFWSGSGNLEVGDLRCPGAHIEGMTLRTYSPATHEWTLYWSTKRLGYLPLPAQVGHFGANGYGDFFSHDTFEGKPIVVRYRWRLLSGDHPYFEQAFSADGGATWETNWTTTYTRIAV